MDDLREVDRPHKIWAVLDGQKSFHSGYMDKGIAEYNLTEANKRAVALDIKSRYVLESTALIVEKIEQQANVVVIPEVQPTI